MPGKYDKTFQRIGDVQKASSSKVADSEEHEAYLEAASPRVPPG